MHPQTWSVKVGDFGASKVLHPTKSKTSTMQLNPTWLAPEVIELGQHSRPADVYRYTGIFLLREHDDDVLNPFNLLTVLASSCGNCSPSSSPLKMCRWSPSFFGLSHKTSDLLSLKTFVHSSATHQGWTTIFNSCRHVGLGTQASAPPFLKLLRS